MKKPLHHKIGKGFRRVHRNITKYLYERDTLFATVWVFVFIWVLGSIPINFYFLNPLKLALKDFDFNDISYAKLDKGRNSSVDDRITIINIGYEDREGIARLIEKTASYQPKVLGLDALFFEEKEAYADSILREELKKHENIVVAQKLNYDKQGKFQGLSGNYFQQQSPNAYGYVNFISEDTGTVRLYSPFEKEAAQVFPSFTSAIIAGYDSSAYKRILERNNKKEYIHYNRRTDKYLILSPEDLFMDRVDSSVLKGRIALLGFVSADPNNIEDKKFTPMNPKFAGKSHPDMNGIVIHANILSMVLDNNFINKVPLWLTWLAAVIIGWLHMSVFIKYFLDNHMWFHLVAKIAQLVSAIFFVYVGIYLFERYQVKLDMKITLIVIVMAVDVIYFYEAWAAWMHKKFNYRTVFKPHQH